MITRTNMKAFMLLLFLGSSVMGAPSSPDSSSCSFPLGVADGTVKDNMMRASSSFSSATVGAENGRVGSERGGGAWCPASLVEQESKEWLEVELAKAARVTGLATQGRWAAGQGQEFAEWVRLQWWSEEEQQWMNAGAPMAANKDTYTKVEMQLEEEVVASKLRILPVSQHPRMVCLRVELLGCSPDGNTKTLEVFTLKTLQCVQCQNFRTLNTRHNTIFSQFNIFYFQISLLHPLPKSQK